MEAAKMEKKLVITYDMINREFAFDNSDDMTYAEILSALEYAKFMVWRDWMNGE